MKRTNSGINAGPGERALEFAGYAMTADLRVPARRMDKAQHQPDDRRLAGAVGPEEPEHVAGADLHVEAVDGA